MKWLTRSVSALTILSASTAFASGYDTPMLFSASHMGMGGTAIGSVDDPSSIFHNPAGLSRSGVGAVHVDVSPLGGVIQGSPDEKALSVKSNVAVSPFFLVGGSYQVHDRIHLGFATYLLGGAAGSYNYNIDKNTASGVKTEAVSDSASLGFIEFAPAISIRIIKGLSFGAAWRPLLTTFDRSRTNTYNANTPNPDPQTYLDMKMKGWAFTGFRLGLQYEIGKFLIGLVYRNKVQTTVNADKIFYAQDILNATYDFILPSKLGFGVQWSGIEDLRLAVDFEYIFNSENQTVDLTGEKKNVVTGVYERLPITNTSKWSDSYTFRVGGGYKVAKPVEVRAGYVFDTAAANPMYPTPFGSPPGPTHIGTVGVGYEFTPSFDMSFAMAYRHGTGSTSQVDTTCPFCGKTGDYAITLMGAYLDARFRFGNVAKDKAPQADDAPAAAPEAAPEVAPEVAPEAASPSVP